MHQIIHPLISHARITSALKGYNTAGKKDKRKQNNSIVTCTSDLQCEVIFFFSVDGHWLTTVYQAVYLT